jgi:hypothetical protein
MLIALQNVLVNIDLIAVHHTNRIASSNTTLHMLALLSTSLQQLGTVTLSRHTKIARRDINKQTALYT